MPATVKPPQVVEDKTVAQHADGGTAVVSRIVKAPPEAVWSVLADGWLYATWVVGASRIREVDLGWPQVGSRIHHCTSDTTETAGTTSQIQASRIQCRRRADHHHAPWPCHPTGPAG